MKKFYIIAVSFFMFTLAISPALAWGGGMDLISNSNKACIDNDVDADADTGKNDAEGSEGGDGGESGKIVNVDGDDVDNSHTGDGGNGGAASAGGEAYTGNATADAGVMNAVNTNRTLINRCACVDENECECGSDIVKNRNRARVENDVDADADTGKNDAEGSEGGDGGESGKIVNVDGDDVSNSTTGTGGTGGTGGLGGFVQSGHADSNAGAINIVNRNVTRIRR